MLQQKDVDTGDREGGLTCLAAAMRAGSMGPTLVCGPRACQPPYMRACMCACMSCQEVC